MKNPKTKEYIICALPGDCQIDSKKVRNYFKKINKTGSRKPNFASNAIQKELTGCLSGGVPPFGSLFGIKTLLEEIVLL